jgi:hypothetical protein
MSRSSSWEEAIPFRTGRRSASAVVTVLALLLGVQTIGCGGGSSGAQNPPPPPPPTFTNIDAAGAGGTAPEGTFGLGIADNGDAFGYFIDANGVVHGFVRNSAGTITTVDAPGAGTTQNFGTEVTAMNASGEATGYYSDPQGILHSFILTAGGTLTEFDPPNSTGSDAFCINDDGAVAGGVLDANGSHGFLRAADGTFTLIDPTGNASQVRSVFPAKINASGQIAGYYFDTNTVHHGFFRDTNGTVTLFDATGAGTASAEGTYAYDMNSGGVIVGGVTTGIAGGLATSHSYIRNTNGTFTEFDPPAAGTYGSIADGINDNGVIVGEFFDANTVNHGYVRNTDGTFVVLDDPSAAQLPYSFTNLDTVPRRINASGAVGGLFSDSAGLRHAFIWQ